MNQLRSNGRGACLRGVRVCVAIPTLLVAAVSCSVAPNPSADPVTVDPLLDLPDRTHVSASRGELVVSRFGGARSGGEGPETVHETVFVPGDDGILVEDNDLRGFLDGAFLWGFNQPTQDHVRLGRRSSNSTLGEYEVFRTIQRWEGIRLPPSARTVSAELVFHVSDAPEYPVEILLYRVHRDWNPGEGGVQKDNVSPPAPGEAWWNGPRFGEEAWGLPGAGYASSAAGADTPATALASTVHQPGDTLLTFSGAELAAYVEERTREAQPLLFLLKVSDVEEDRRGAQIEILSANYGDSKNQARRPRLSVRWSSPVEEELHRDTMILEHGRTARTGALSVAPGGWLNVGFEAAGQLAHPSIEIRGGSTPSDTTEWTAVTGPVENSWSWVEVRTCGLHNPVAIGDPFEFEIRETWVLPEPSEAKVDVAFVSPSGKRHVRTLAYAGGYHWRSSFVPDEVGPWSYRWAADFTDDPLVSAVGHFDVVGGSPARVKQALEKLTHDLTEVRDTRSEAQLERWRERFVRLERAALALETPGSFSADSSGVVEAIRRAREVLAGRSIPEDLPLRVSPSHAGRTEHMR